MHFCVDTAQIWLSPADLDPDPVLAILDICPVSLLGMTRTLGFFGQCVSLKSFPKDCVNTKDKVSKTFKLASN